MRRIDFVVISAALLLAPALAAISPRQSAAPNSGALEVTVVDSITREGIPEAQITLISAPRTSSVQPKPEFADGAGRFTARNLPPGGYTVRVESQGYFPPDPPPVILVSADRTASVTVPMIAGGTIAGRVTADGKPQSGVTVQAFQIGYLNGYPVMSAAASRVTDDRGQYRLFHLRPGEYLVAVTPRNMATQSFFDVTPASASSTSALTVTPGDQPQRTFFPGTVDPVGAERVSIRTGQEVLNIDIPVKTARLYRVSGEIRVPVPSAETSAALQPVSPQRPFVEARVSLFLRDPNTPDELQGISRESRILLLPAGNFLVGTFQAINVLPGIYNCVVLILPNSAQNAGPRIPTTAFPIEVRGSDVEGLRFDLRPGVTVKGTMTVDEEPPGANKGYVRLQSDGVFSRTGGAPRFDVSANEKSGAFSNPGVAMGRLRAVPGPSLPRNLYIEDVRSGGQSVFDAGFDVASEEPSAVEVLLRSGAATVSGSVIDDEGKPVVNAVVELVPVSNRLNLARFHDAVADIGGQFSISSVAPGEYKLFAWPRASHLTAAYNPAFLSRFEEKGVPVTISQTSTTLTIELTVISSQAQ